MGVVLFQCIPEAIPPWLEALLICSWSGEGGKPPWDPTRCYKDQLWWIDIRAIKRVLTLTLPWTCQLPPGWVLTLHSMRLGCLKSFCWKSEVQVPAWRWERELYNWILNWMKNNLLPPLSKMHLPNRVIEVNISETTRGMRYWTRCRQTLSVSSSPTE